MTLSSAFATLALLLAAPPPPEVRRSDLDRFPSRAEAVRQLDFAEAHVAFLADRVATHGDGWGLRGWLEEARLCRDCWGALLAAQDEDFSPIFFWVSGDQLRYLRSRLGSPAYYRGAMPPPAPFWRFSRAD